MYHLLPLVLLCSDSVLLILHPRKNTLALSDTWADGMASGVRGLGTGIAIFASAKQGGGEVRGM